MCCALERNLKKWRFNWFRRHLESIEINVDSAFWQLFLIKITRSVDLRQTQKNGKRKLLFFNFIGNFVRGVTKEPQSC
jgi:hypothetical protein